MPYVIAGLVLVGAVALLNLVLLMVILRRWQELAAVRRRDDFAAQGPQPGDGLPDFTATALSGRILTQDDSCSGELLLGIFSHDCPSCTDSLPDFTERADRARAAGGRVLALVIGAEAGESSLTAQLVGPRGRPRTRARRRRRRLFTAFAVFTDDLASFFSARAGQR
ncbi:hypothetical protein ACF1BU_03475 [Streptomyces sp. NPDC014724]|uniref:hypothetical protein n=1 Tax=unclassified Streptomyces TaxID=2593676 RepID=UPI0036FD62E5